MASFWFYFKLGYEHVLNWQAYDHLLFLIVLTVAYTFNDWKKVLWLVTVFTIGHTISLILSVYDILKVNTALAAFLIPVTILVMAIITIFTAGKGTRKEKLGVVFFMTLFFGLIHGLGFSSYFRQIVPSGDSKLLILLEFSLGVEFAQLIIVVLVLLFGTIIQSVFRFNRRDWIMIIAAMVLGLVIPMLIESYPY